MENRRTRSEFAAGVDLGTVARRAVWGLGLHSHSSPENNLKQKLGAFLNSGWQILDSQIILYTFLYFESFSHQKLLKNLSRRWWLLA